MNEALPFALFGSLMLSIWAIGILFFALWVWMLIECVRFEPDQGNDKIIWILVIILAGGIGALIYFFVRRPERRRLYGR